jgi:hypothetical protein
MKNQNKAILLKTILFVFTISIFFFCSKVNNKNMTVIKDCTGSYLRFNDKDYHICNIETVEYYEDGAEVKASFKKVDDCPDNDEVNCEMLHNNEGWIEVTKIK